MTEITVYNRETGEVAVNLTGELVSEEHDIFTKRTKVTVNTKYGEQFVEFSDEDFRYELDEPSED